MDPTRVVTIGVALLAVCGLFILGGAGIPFGPHSDTGPDEQSVATAYDQYIGEPVTTSGVVVDADTNRVHVSPDDTDLVVTLDVDPAHEVTLQDGHEVTFSGTITADRTIVVGPEDHIKIRAPWEVTYMFGVSFVGALLTGLLIVNYWRLDTQRFVIEPRAEPFFAILEGGQDDG